MLILKVVGLLKTIAILVIVFLVIRFVSRLMVAKQVADTQRKEEKEKAFKEKEQGKVSITRTKNLDAEDVDYTEVK